MRDYAYLRLAAYGGALSLCAALPWAVRAQDRPSETDMFGAAPPSAAEEPVPPGVPAAAATIEHATPPSAGTDARDALVLGREGSVMFSEEPAPADPLTIGGMLYMRMQGTAYEHTEPAHWGVSAPALLDVYLDARPNDRVRGFALGRMSYDPLLASNASAALSGNSGTAGSSS
ncbi:MAG: hypothetical protein RL701_1427, partial [Pseudomonadota bacterium]